MDTKIIDINGLSIEYVDSRGHGPWVFLYHGNSSSLEAYSSLFNSSLAQQYRLIAVNFPGHGRSSLPKEETALSIPELGRLTLEIARYFHAQNYIMIGQSIGGHALLEVLDKHHQAAGLMLLSSPPISLETLGQAFLPDPTGGLLFEERLSSDDVETFAKAFVHQVDEYKLTCLKRDIKKTDGRFRRYLGQSLARQELVDERMQLAQANIPVAMLCGTEDAFLNIEYFNTLDPQHLWQNKVFHLKGAGHALMLEESVFLGSFINEFIAHALAQTKHKQEELLV